MKLSKLLAALMLLGFIISIQVVNAEESFTRTLRVNQGLEIEYYIHIEVVEIKYDIYPYVKINFSSPGDPGTLRTLFSKENEVPVTYSTWRGDIKVNATSIFSDMVDLGITVPSGWKITKIYTVTPTQPPEKIPNPFILNLQAGWNLISLPLVPVDENGTEITNLTQILAALSGGSVERILTYNAETQLWSEYPNGSIPLTNMTAGKGYFLKMRESANLTLKGVEIYNNMPRSYTLYEGWNLIGYHSESTIPVEKALNSIDGNYSSLWMLDNGEWKSYIAGDFQNMQPGKGYWIYMNSKGVIPQV